MIGNSWGITVAVVTLGYGVFVVIQQDLWRDTAS
jgi:hypothetical protein